MSRQQYLLTGLDAETLQTILETSAHASQVTLEFLMRRWNGRFATYNVALPLQDSPADSREVRRGYRIIGRAKFNTQPNGAILLTLTPPALCDPTLTSEEAEYFETFRATLEHHFARYIREGADV